ncbi:cell division cycle protein 20 homolog B-like [Lates japonicus]
MAACWGTLMELLCSESLRARTCRTVSGSSSRCEPIWKWQVARTCARSRRSAHLAPVQLVIKRRGPRVHGLLENKSYQSSGVYL